MQNTAKLFRSMGGSPLVAIVVTLLGLPSAGAFAQVSQATSAVAAVIPQQVRYTGTLPNRPGDIVEAVFKIYATAEGGEALWTETQRVSVSADGSYSVLLGAASQNGLPQTVFAAGQARWVGVTIDRAEESLRSPLSSVAYAMKAGDAESVGGLSAANLVTKDELAKLAQTVATTTVQAQPAIQPETTPTGSGTTDYVPLWTASATLGNSNLFQAASGFMGIGTTTPGGPLQLSTGATGGANATMMLTQTSAASGNYYADIGLYNSKGLIGNLSALGAGYPAGNLFVANDVVFLGGQQNAGTNLIFLTNTSGALKFGTGGFAVANERMRIGAAGGVSVGNGYVTTDPGAGNLIVSGKVGVGTKTPAAILEVNGTAKFDGLITFDAGQVFPGTGTLTGISTSSPLTGSGTSGTVALGLNTTTLTTTLETTYDGRYALLSGGNDFSSYIDAFQTTGPGYAAFLGFGTNGSVGTFGDSDTGYGVEGRSTSGQGVVGYTHTPAPGSSGVLGYTGTSFSATYSSEAGILDAGVWADTSSTGSGIPAGLVATTDTGYAAIIVNNTAYAPALLVANNTGEGAVFQGTTGDGIEVSTAGGGDAIYGINYSPVPQQGGIEGVSASTSGTGAGFEVYGGVWGDTGVDNDKLSPGVWSIGVLGTSDNGHAGVFLNTSNDWSTLYVGNYGTGGSGDVHTGLFNTLMATSATGTCGISGGSMSCTGPIKSLASAGGSRTVETYAMQSPENWMEDFGTGAMQGGVGVVQIDRAFADTVTGDASYHVFLTPRGDSKGLYVTNVTASSFEVREAGGGTSSLSFDYRIVAKRAGYEAQRMVDVTDTFARETGRAKLAKVEGLKKAPQVRKSSIVEQALKTPHRTIVPNPAPRKILPQAQAVTTQKAVSK
jgi:hypothetical protein